MNNYIVKEKISNHPLFQDTERFVCVYKQTSDAMRKEFVMHFLIKYVKDGVDITNDIIQKRNTIKTDAQTKLLLRDEENCPIPNPEFVEPVQEYDDDENPLPLATYDEYDEFMWAYGWDVVMSMINQPTNVVDLIKFYVHLNDTENYFD